MCMTTRLELMLVSYPSKDRSILWVSRWAYVVRVLCSFLLERLQRWPQAVVAFRANDSATAATKLQEKGRVHEYASAEHRLAAVALAYTTQQDRAVVIAPDAGERRELRHVTAAVAHRRQSRYIPL